VASFLQPLLVRDAGPGVLHVRGRAAAPVATTVETAFDSATRTRGLLGRPGLSPDHAMVIAPCSAIHTFGMQFAIDVIFAAEDGRIVKIRRNMRAGRMTGAIAAFATIEVAAGEADRHGLKAGDYLEVTVPAPSPRAPAPR
jgi:uncharacterized membrane protein (UPF0127 family)